jgi:hypothetical protein
LLVGRETPRILDTKGPGTGTKADFDTFRQKQACLIKSRLVLMTALRQPKVSDLSVIKKQTDPLEWLEKQIQVDWLCPEILAVSIIGGKTEELATVVNAVVDAYLKEIVNKEKKEMMKNLDTLLQLKTEYEANLRDRRKELRDVISQEGPPESRKTYNSLKLDAWHRELIGCQRKMLQARVSLSLMEAEKKAGAAKDSPDQKGLILQLKFQEAEEKALQDDLAKLEKEAQNLRKGALNLENYRLDIEEREAVLKRVTNQIQNLTIELQAPSRITLLQDAVIRNPKK